MFIVWTLVVSGLFLIFLEFFLPGAIMAIGGAILLLASLFIFHMTNPSIPLFALFLIALMAGCFVVVKLAIWRVKATGYKGTIYSAFDQEGYQASIFPKEMIGKVGMAATDLKPSGHIRIDDKTFQALSKTGYIDKGSPIKVLGGLGSHLIVTTIESNS